MWMGRTPDLPLCQDHWRKIQWQKWLGVIRRGTFQTASQDSRWACEKVSDLWPDIEPYSDSSYDGSIDEVIKFQENTDNH